MGLFKSAKRAVKKITKPVAKVLNKVVPNELKPFLPYAAAFVPFAAPASFGIGSLSPMVSRALLSGGANLAAQLSQEGSEGDFSGLSALLAAGTGYLSTPGAADQLRGMTAAGQTDKAGILKQLEAAPVGTSTGSSGFLGSAKDFVLNTGAKAAEALNVSGEGIGSILAPGGTPAGFNMETLSAAAVPFTQGSIDLGIATARKALQDYEAELAAFNAQAGADQEASDSARRAAIISSMTAANFTQDVIDETLGQLGLKDGGIARLGFDKGGDVEGKIDLMGDLSKEDKKTFAELKKLLFDATIKDRPGYAQNMLEVANPFDDKDADSKGSQERARAFDRGNKRLIYGIISTKNDPEGREKFVEEFTENYENMMYPAGRMAEGGIARLGFDNGGDVSFGGITEAVKNVAKEPKKFLVDELEVTVQPGQSEKMAIVNAMFNDVDDVMPEDRKAEFYRLYLPQLRDSGEISKNDYESLVEELQLNKKDGGIASFKDGGIMNLGGKEMDMRTGGFIPIGAKERADDVPARLSKNEFVMTADAVRAAGGGSVNKGAKRMYDLMHNLEARA